MLLDRDRFSLFCASLLLCFTTLGGTPANAIFVNQILTQAQTAENQKDEADRLLIEGKQKLEQRQFQTALEAFKKALALYLQAKDRKSEGVTLYNIGNIYYGQAEFSQAVEFYQQALVIWREVGDRTQEVRTLNDIGVSYSNLSQYPKALQYYQQALVIFKQIGNRSGEGTTLNNIGLIYSRLGQYPKALEYYQRALAIRQQIGDRLGEGITLNNVGGIYSRLGQYPKALEYYQQALAIFKQIGDHSGESATLNNIGGIYDNLKQYPKALDHYQQALAIFKQIGDRLGEGTTLNNIGGIYNNLGQYPKALDYYQQALAIRQQIGDRLGEGTTLNNIGLIYDSLGQYPKALESHQRALAIRQQIGDRLGEGTTLNNIGLIYHNLGQYPKALESHQRALAIRQQIGDRSGVGTTFNNIGGIYHSLGQYPKALDYYQQALAIRQQIGDRSGEGAILNNIGGIDYSLGQYPKALEYYQQALVIIRQIGERSDEGTILNNIGLIYDNLGQYPKALECYQQALAIFKQIGDRSGEGNTLNNTGMTYYNLKQYADAEKNLQESVEIWESLRPGLNDQNKISIFDTQESTYRNLQRALVAQQKTNQALEVAERGRAKAFIELLASRLSPDLQKQNPESLQKKFIVNLEQIKQIALMQNASVVEYSIVSDEDLYIWVIQPTGEVKFRSIDLKKSLNTSLAKLVTSSRDSIGARGRASIEIEPVVDAADQKKRSQQLHKLLIDPIADLLPQDPDSHVIFIPQGQLFLVPFPALQDANGKYLIEKHTILTAPAIQVLDLTHQQSLKPKPADLQAALVIGNPTMPKVTTKLGDLPQQLSNLPAAEQEAKEIAKLFKTKAFTGNQAIKAKILPKLSQARIIHLATHGLLDDFKGLGVPGAIALAPSGNGELNDGLLTANEILDLNLNAELIVLSACDTGRGKITGDGVIGLSRSLITAGTPSVIVSLWSVPDAPTAQLMSEFYRNWLSRKLDKAQALRQAMLTTMKNHPNPKDWAAFTLIGEAE
ncbi:MAG: tetratricopeptide repeat protein [Nostoc sp. DedSLP01]|nr:CHAT domain-containing tetratricopeptide repeat protein [Nostoc sp. DedSLP05]MDZ8098298.1 CHAT domain-containing tetratricopeptide repeat protein [Nostoc sp. DedSLP01]